MRLFASDERRPGRPLLMFGLAAFILVALGGWFGNMPSKVIAALMSGLGGCVSLIVSWVIFMLAVGLLSGVPSLSLSYVLGIVGRRTFAGAALLLSAIYAILDVAGVVVHRTG